MSYEHDQLNVVVVVVVVLFFVFLFLCVCGFFFFFFFNLILLGIINEKIASKIRRVFLKKKRGGGVLYKEIPIKNMCDYIMHDSSGFVYRLSHVKLKDRLEIEL